MNTPQKNTLEQSKVLFESADNGNAIHWELSKYLFRNMNSIDYALNVGWLENASDEDKEFAKGFVSLRDQFKHLFEDESGIAITPLYCDELISDILDSYDFSTEAGQIILNMIKHHCATSMKSDPDEFSELNQEIQCKLEKIEQNMKPQN